MRREVGGGGGGRGEERERRGRRAFQVRVFLSTGIPSLSVLRSSDPFFVFVRLFSFFFFSKVSAYKSKLRAQWRHTRNTFESVVVADGDFWSV